MTGFSSIPGMTPGNAGAVVRLRQWTIAFKGESRVSRIPAAAGTANGAALVGTTHEHSKRSRSEAVTVARGLRRNLFAKTRIIDRVLEGA
jgi:hypothetical protein